MTNTYDLPFGLCSSRLRSGDNRGEVEPTDETGDGGRGVSMAFFSGEQNSLLGVAVGALDKKFCFVKTL